MGAAFMPREGVGVAFMLRDNLKAVFGHRDELHSVQAAGVADGPRGSVCVGAARGITDV